MCVCNSASGLVSFKESFLAWVRFAATQVAITYFRPFGKNSHYLLPRVMSGIL